MQMRLGVCRIHLMLLALLLASAGCTSYRISRQVGDHPGLSIRLPTDGRAEYAVVRLENEGAEYLFIDWANARLRGPDLFEIPATVDPGSALSYLHPGSRAEYHLYPDHQYRHPDTKVSRRNSLTSSLVPEALFERYSPYILTVFLRVCSSPSLDGCTLGSAEEDNAAWRSVQIGGVVEGVSAP